MKNMKETDSIDLVVMILKYSLINISDLVLLVTDRSVEEGKIFSVKIFLGWSQWWSQWVLGMDLELIQIVKIAPNIVSWNSCVGAEDKSIVKDFISEIKPKLKQIEFSRRISV